KLDEIVAFADIGAYIDEPVKHYSSGMVVRLGFAIVAALRPDLLITDEVLAVGDESFQKKCVRWIEDYLAGGGTMILVSHSMYHVQKLCRRACWLQHGRIAASGDVFDVTQAYLAHQERTSAAAVEAREAVAARGQEFHLVEYSLNGASEDVPLLIEQGASLRARVRVHSRDGRVPVVGFGLGRADGTSVYGTNTEMDGVLPVRESDNVYSIELEFARLPLLPGSYVLRAHALDTEGVRLFDTIVREITVRGESREFGLVRLAHAWSGGAREALAAPVSAGTAS
ncbi:MAG TPA: Wzt carbohydrate-binding domain-containing protein, partial [Rudaea sp.]|nr:Wzt carbohydrate-binding domain-containing protein [Rudaea sp.]